MEPDLLNDILCASGLTIADAAFGAPEIGLVSATGTSERVTAIARFNAIMKLPWLSAVTERPARANSQECVHAGIAPVRKIAPPPT